MEIFTPLNISIASLTVATSSLISVWFYRSKVLQHKRQHWRLERAYDKVDRIHKLALDYWLTENQETYQAKVAIQIEALFQDIEKTLLVANISIATEMSELKNKITEGDWKIEGRVALPPNDKKFLEISLAALKIKDRLYID